MANQYTSKVALSDGEILIDLTQDDVKPEHVQSGIYFHDKTGERKAGTNTKTVDASEATAEASEVLASKTFGKGNELQTGTMPDNSGNDITITDKAGKVIPRGYYDGTSMAKLSDPDLANLTPANIKEGVTILGVEGEFGADDFSSSSITVKPLFTEQNINPADTGVTFFSSVKVEAIAVTRKDNEAGGVTVTIG